MESANIVFFKDLEIEPNRSRMDVINEENINLYNILHGNFDMANQKGVREDVLIYISEHASEIPKDMDACLQISTLAAIEKAGPEWYELLVSIPTRTEENITEYGILLIECINAGMPINKAIEYLENSEDQFQFSEAISNYDPSFEEKIESSHVQESKNITDTEPETCDEENIQDNGAVEEGDDSDLEIAQNQYDIENEKKMSVILSNKKEDDMNAVNMFNQILSIMDVNKPDDDDVLEQLQNTVETMQRLLVKAISMKSDDKALIKRLNEVTLCQRNFINGQQKKINSLRNEIEFLKQSVEDGKKSLLMYQNVNTKLKEISAIYGEGFNLGLPEK